MRDERRAAVYTVSISIAIFLAGLVSRFTVVGAIGAGAFALLRFNGYRERRKLRKYMLAHRQRFAEELDSGQARVIVCQPSRIIEREELEDEGAFWIFDAGDGRYLAICGQDYYETPRFPSAHFEVVMGAHHGSLIGIRSHGPRMPSTVVAKGNDISWDVFPESEITVFAAPPNVALPVILERLQKSAMA